MGAGIARLEEGGSNIKITRPGNFREKGKEEEEEGKVLRVSTQPWPDDCFNKNYKEQFPKIQPKMRL